MQSSKLYRLLLHVPRLSVSKPERSWIPSTDSYMSGLAPLHYLVFDQSLWLLLYLTKRPLSSPLEPEHRVVARTYRDGNTLNKA